MCNLFSLLFPVLKYHVSMLYLYKSFSLDILFYAVFTCLHILSRIIFKDCTFGMTTIWHLPTDIVPQWWSGFQGDTDRCHQI